MSDSRYHQLGLKKDDLRQMYYTMLLARRLDERMWLLNRAGKIPFVISCQGHEAAQVGAAFALDRSVDYLLPYYRDMAMVIAFGMTAKELMLSAFAKGEDPNSGGRQMPGHFGAAKYRIVTGSSPVTTQVPHAVGVALAARMDGKQLVAFASFGEGSSNQGDFHEGLNFAGVHKLPVIFFCENNGYAISVPQSKQLACSSVADRAAGYGMPGYSVDGDDPLEVYRVVKEARDRAIRGEGPTLIEARTYRFTPHSSDDDDSTYRDPQQVEALRQKDPVKKFGQFLRESGIFSEEEQQRLEAKVDEEVDAATQYAQSAPYAAPEHALKYVYAEN